MPVGAYLSGGLDSSLVTSLAAGARGTGLAAYSGTFAEPGYDESPYARTVASSLGIDLREVEIQPGDFVDRLETIVYHLDFPVAGPGSFPQYLVSELAAQDRKVLLGGQGADEIFGGYVRYLIAYFERCIRGAIDGTMSAAPFVVTYESIIPNLVSLRGYEPLLQEFWREGVFDDFDARYFRLIDRSRGLVDEVRWEFLGDYSPFEAFRRTFHGENLRGESAFDSMTHFDFKTLLPALLHVEDRVSMAHGLEARVPFLDHPLVELAATMPAIVKFRDGEMKYALRRAAASPPLLPPEILGRKDKMGFPVPLREWVGRPGLVRDFVFDVLGSSSAANRALIDNGKVLARLDDEPQFGRRLWGFLCLELWQRAFHDRAASYRERLADAAV